MRIIYTKKRINKNTGIITDFKKFIQRIDITSDLIKTLTKEINNIIDYSIGVSKNDIKNKKKINTDKNLKHFTTDELRYVSNFYSEIFDLILFFLEYPINKNNINNINILNICEENVYELLELIEFMIKANIENNDKIDIALYIFLNFMIISYLRDYILKIISKILLVFVNYVASLV